MEKFDFKLIEKKEIADNTWSFSFERKKFPFLPGQFMNYIIEHPIYTDEKGSMRTFSIASSPTKDNLMLATRNTGSAFKRSLIEMPLGSIVKAMGPMGKFTLAGNAGKPIVLLAGGIGITPFRSMIEDAVEEKTNINLHLFYANKMLKDAAFFDDLEKWSKNSAFRFMPTLTEGQPPGWKYEKGRITEEMIKRHIDDIQTAVFYVAGPPAMVDALTELLIKMGIGQEKIFSEKFIGYK